MSQTSRRLERDTHRFIDLDRRIVEIASWLAPSRLLNPTFASRRNALESFRADLHRGRLGDPWLEYLPLPHHKIRRSRAALALLEFGDTEVDSLLRDQTVQLVQQLDLLEARGTPRFADIAVQIYGLPDSGLLDVARRILRGEYLVNEVPSQLGAPDLERLDATTIAASMQAELKAMNVHDWQVVVVEEMSARMAVSARHREVRIKSDSVFTHADRERLIVHELRTHVMRACNGFRTGLLNLGLGLRNYMATEEGLASHMEQKHGMLRRSQVETYAFRALGAWFAHQYGFAETVTRLRDLGASPGLAWDVALRVKRGLTDTSQPGSFPKDFVYLHGRELVADYLVNGGKESDLFLGKVAIEQIPVIKRILARWNFNRSC